MRLRALFLHEAFLWGSGIILVVALGFAVRAAITAQWMDVLVWIAVAATAALAIGFHNQLPILIGFLLALAAAANGAGYNLTLWHQETLFDELVHAFTSFAGMTAIGWGLCRNDRAGRWPQAVFFAVLIAIGLVIGLLWEGFEWLVGMIGSPRDTVIDLIADGLGAAVAAILGCRFMQEPAGSRSAA